jgi:hypothetical protein
MKTYQEALKSPEFWTWVNFCMTSDEFIEQYERLRGPIRNKSTIQKKIFDDFTKFAYDLWARLPDEAI